MGKSSKHKSQNVHSFISFSERISNVNIDVIHQIRRVDNDEGEETYFGEALSKWTELDLTDHFTTFRKEISCHVQTFEQLVHHKEDIILSLVTHLSVPNSLALNALLDLLVQLARDLQHDFLPHFHKFFTLLVEVLKTRSQDVEALEQTFQALAYLFRVLWRYLIKDFTQVFSFFSDLLSSSQKDYIRVFAAESCAYLLRKVKKQDALLNFLFGSLKSSPELMEGVGLLLFEMVKGVKSHFHTVSQKVFPLILHKLGPWSPSGKLVNLPRAAVEGAVTVFMQGCAQHMNREHSREMWDMLLDCISQVHTACVEVECADQDQDSGKKSTGLVKHLGRLLKLTSVWLSHNKGSLVEDPEQVAMTLGVVLKSPCKPDVLGSDILGTVSALFISCHGRLPVDLIFKLIHSIFTDPFVFSDLRILIRSLTNMPFFEKDILPGCMKRIHFELPIRTENQKEEVVEFIAEILLHKMEIPVTGADIHMLKPYPIDRSWSLTNKENSFACHIESVITEATVSEQPASASELSVLWSAVVCLPHVSILKCLEKAMALWQRLSIDLQTCQDQQERHMRLVIGNQLLQGILMLHQASGNSSHSVEWKEVLDLLRSDPCSPFAIQSVDLFLSCSESSTVLTANTLIEVFDLLQPNLVSPSHIVRLLTCHTLSLFPVELPDRDDGITRQSFFTTILAAEEMVPTLHNYRDKLVHLRRLDYDSVVRCLPQGPFVTAPLLFLLGNEFWNFKLMWQPLSDIIASHARGLDTKNFWDVMLSQLRRAAEESERELKSVLPEKGTKDEGSLSLFEKYTHDHLADRRKPDFTNYRIQLWRAMRKFPEICVLRSDDLCTLYIDFLRNEFNNVDEEALMHQNILATPDKTSPSPAIPDVDDEMEVDEVEDADIIGDDDHPVQHVGGKKVVVKQRRAAVMSLLIHMELFATFKKQRSMFNEKEVQNTFSEFLKNKNPMIQKAAFECVLTYKSPHVLPYRENFYRLLDDKTFKSEIILFRVDEESTEIREVDREGFLHVLMRILYGKMHGKTGNETAGKSHSHVRKSIVFGFLSGCKAEELRYFLELLFQPCMHFVTDDPVVMVKDTIAKIDLGKMIPLKKIKGVLNTVNTVSQKLGHRIQGFAHTILHILLGLSATLNVALAQRDLALAGVINLIKSLRHMTVNRITQFLENFEDLDFSASELEALFLAAVWPQAEKLVLEGVHSPTPLMKLFTCMSCSERLFPLLAYCKDMASTTATTSPLSCMFALLNAPSTSQLAASAILEVITNLLDGEEEGEGEKRHLSLPGPFAASHDGNEGTLREKILLPHIPEILKYLQKALYKMTSGNLGKKQICVVELKILSRVSSFVTSSEECGILCDLLVPFLGRGSVLSQDVEESTLKSLTNLMKYVEKPQSFYRSIAQLFTTVERRESRVLLCKLFGIISSMEEQLVLVAGLVEKLNAWDKRRTDEPDYMVRLDAFQQVIAVISSQAPNADVLLPVVCNCCYFITNVDDLSVRDNATHCLITITKRIAETMSDGHRAFNLVIEKCLVPQVKLGIRSKSEAVRHEFLAVLQSLVNNYSSHQMFTGLTDLCDKDPEADFFENIRHIQIHKRSRALRRLYKHLRDHQFRTEIHMSYFIPLVYTFITDHSYAKHANVQDAAVDLLGAICKQLPWQHYHQLLRFYLKLLTKKVETQRQIVRIIVALLDAFRFDLSNSTYRFTFSPKGMDKKDLTTPEANVPETAVKDAEDDTMDDTIGEAELDDDLPMVLDLEEEEKGQAGDDKGVNENQKLVCSAAAATRIHRTVVVSLLPKLHKIVTQKAKSDEEHKLVRSKYPEDDEILRVPIALAMIKLLQNLPKGTLENRLPGILLKICNFLRSRSKDVRSTARETLEKAAICLGSRFFPFIVKELRGALIRGYQLHVLGFTTHYLLKSLVLILNPGDLDPAMKNIQEIFHPELFGQVADEKEVEAIKAKFMEAKFIKGYDAYELLAMRISPSCLNGLIQPIREVLESTSSQRIAGKAEMVLRKIVDGLMANQAIPVETMMVFIHSLTANLMVQFVQEDGPKMENDEKTSNQVRMPESCLLLQKTTPRGGDKPKANRKTNIHVLVEFGLHLLNAYLKKSCLEPSEQLHLELLDPLVPVIRDCLSNAHVKTSSNAVRCISWLLRFPLPSLQENITKIAQGLFLVLRNYSGASTAKGGNEELITMCFKAVTVLVREVSYYQITTEQLQVLLTYCEEDLYNYSRQSTAFSLIRAILSRQLDVPQLHEVMEKLFEMSVTASAAGPRLHSRQVVLHYLMNYPQGKALRRHLMFYIQHLQYELEDGRESVLDMMISIFNNFPQNIVNNHCPKFFSALAMASYNDSSPKVRKLVIAALKTLLSKVDHKHRRTLFKDVVKWIKSDDMRIQAMGCQVCGIFVEVEGGKFEMHMDEVIPLLQLKLDPARYSTEEENIEPSTVELKDMCLLAVFNMVLKIVRELNIVRDAKFAEDVHIMWGHVLSHLTYPHTQIRLGASQLLGLMFSTWDPEEVAKQQAQEQEQNVAPRADGESHQAFYLLTEGLPMVRKFAIAFCQQLRTPALDDALATQAVKNLLYLARLNEILMRPEELAWLTKQVMKEANYEVIKNVKVTVKRTHAFKWVAAVGVSLKPESVQSLLKFVLPGLQREMSENAQDQDLKILAQEVIELLKKQVGVEDFTKAFVKSQKWRLEKKDGRKRQAAAEVVTNPDIAARKKIKHNLKKKENRKRRAEERRPEKKRMKKSKLSILNIKVDDDDNA